MRYSTLYKTPIKIVTIFLLLSSLHPGNYLHGQKQPDTLSFYLPNILVTAIESKTPGTVSLLPASTLEHTQPITISDLTQLLPGGLTNNSGVTDAQYFSVREVSLKNGVNQFHKNAAMGAQIWVDGSPLHFNTGINEPYEGYDARFLSLNQVKEAEIIRGIPSARYGNLTNSVLLLKTHQGRMPLSTSIRYNPKLKQYMLGKGFCISPQGHTLNLLADYTSQGDFHTGGIRLANLYHWLPAGKKLELSLTYTSRIEKIKEYAKTQRQRIKIILENERIEDEIPDFVQENFTKSPPMLELSGIFCEEDIPYNEEEYTAHLKESMAFAEQNPNYTLKCSTAHAFHNLKIIIHEGQWVMVSKGKTPAIHFVIRHPKLRSAIECFIPPITEDE